ncbi:MAG TPA: NAD-dependent epimerase/dehydratase family protein [Thermoanaerobaculia bacterium]|nr:NAD-dependent epimerase/dehydratase family protein [Thermoanaerobaculia bacterium]
MRRRTFLAATLAGTGALVLPRGARAGAGTIHRKASRPLRILFLGGTDFVGPAVVELALERGHEVTLFNRGTTNPWLFTHLERLVGNRHPDREPGVKALQGERRWDAVIDTWQGSPLAVELTARLLQERVGSYTYISSIAVYRGRNYRKESFDETAPLPPAEMPDSFDVELPYPVRKQLGEAAVAQSFPGRRPILRAYGIVGTDARGKFVEDRPPYWPIRLRRGGDVLAPGDGEDFTQWTDLRDLAEFALHTIESSLGETYNVSQGATFKEYLKELATLSPGSRETRLHWVPAQFLFERGIRSFVDVPGWVWRGEVEKGFFYASTKKARAAGFHPRSAAETFRPVIDAFLRHYDGFDFTDSERGVAIARREQEILSAWHDR